MVQGISDGIQQAVYCTYDKVCGCCSTDNKIYALLIVGRVLQTAAIVACAASIACAFVVGPIVLVGLIPAVVLGILGTHLSQQPREVNDCIQAARPFVAGQPIGLKNGGNNCWVNSGLQVLSHVPAFHARMRQLPELNQFLDRYAAARAAGTKVSSDIDTNEIRQILHQMTRGVQEIHSGPVQEDAAALFENLFQGPNALYHFQQELNGVPAAVQREPMVQLTIPRGAEIPSFDTLFNQYFNHQTDLGINQRLYFPEAPQDLVVQVRRFYHERNAAGQWTQGKINDAIAVPENVPLPGQFVRGGGDAAYTCDAFLQHLGSTLLGGHYVAYLKVDGSWWYVSDTAAYAVSDQQAQEAMAHGYIYHYAKS